MYSIIDICRFVLAWYWRSFILHNQRFLITRNFFAIVIWWTNEK